MVYRSRNVTTETHEFLFVLTIHWYGMTGSVAELVIIGSGLSILFFIFSIIFVLAFVL